MAETSNYACRVCQRYFGSRAARDYHQRSHTATCRILGEVYSRLASGLWNCHTCSRNFVKRTSLDKHVRKYHAQTENSSSHETNAEVDVIGENGELETTTHANSFTPSRNLYRKEADSVLHFEPPLSDYQLYVNMKYGFVSCNLCGHQTTLKRAIHHIQKGCHLPRVVTPSALSSLRQQLAEIAVRVGHESLPEPLLNTDGIQPIEGINIMDGFRCRICPYSSPNLQTVKRHVKTSGHSDYFHSRIQGFRVGIKRTYASIKEGHSIVAQATDESVSGEFFSDAETLIRDQWGSFLTDEGGQVTLGGPAMEHIMRYESVLPSETRQEWTNTTRVRPQDDDAEKLLWLREIVRGLYKDIEEIQKTTRSLVLKYIMDQDEEENTKYFTPLQNSRDRYADTLWSYCVFIIRMVSNQSVANGIFAFPAMIDISFINEVISSIEARDVSDTKEKLWAMFQNHFFCCFDYAFNIWHLPVMKWFLLRASDHENHTGFLTADKMSITIAQMLYSIRGCVLYFLRPRLSESTSKSMLEELKYVNKNVSSPFGSLQEQYEFLSRLSTLEYAPSRILADLHNSKVLHIDGKYINTDLMERAMHRVIVAAGEKLKALLFGRRFEEVCAPPLASIQDHLRSIEVGCWFGRHLMRLQLPYTTILLKWMQSDPSLKERFFEGNQIRESEARNFLYAAERAREYLMVAYHLVSGLPARATEITLLRLRNTTTQLRNLYISGNRMFTISRYSKNQSRTQRDSFIARFLPNELAKLFIIEILVLRPALVSLAMKLGENEMKNSLMTNLFPQGAHAITPERLRRSFSQIMAQEGNMELSFGAYRHVALHWARSLLPQHPPALAPYYPLQAGHSLQTSMLRYAVQETAPLSATSQDLNVHLFVSSEWHKLFRFHEIGSNDDARAVQRPSEDRSDSSTTSVSRIEVITLLEARESNEIQPEVVDGLGLTPALVRRALYGLRRIYCNSSTFTGPEQAQIVSGSLAAKRDILGVLPTGGGKSATFLVPASLNDGVTIAIFPLRVLVEQMFQLSKDMHIPCKVFNPKVAVEENIAPLLIASVEACDSDAFVAFFRRCSEIKRIVIDEAHLCVSWSSWRHRLQCLRVVRLRDVPIILLTATMPISYYSHLADFFLTKPLCIRAGSNRPNHRYTVKKFQKEDDLEDELQKVLRNFKDKEDDKARWIIYCLTINKVEQTANLLRELTGTDVPCYHSKLDGRVRRNVFKAWRDGLAKGVVATTAFGMGVDYKCVRLVIVLIGSMSFMDLVQQFGRAGRDGQASDCILLSRDVDLKELADHATLGQQSANVPIDEIARKETKLMVDYCNTNRCRRWFVTAYSDGSDKAVLCAALKENVLCDVCQVSSRETSPINYSPSLNQPDQSVQISRLRTEELRQNVLNEGRKLKDLLERVKGHCLYCLVVREAWIKHSNCRGFFGLCLRCFSEQHSVNTCRITRRTATGLCSRCHIPNSIADVTFHLNAFGSSCDSGFEGILRDMGWLLFRKKITLIQMLYRDVNSNGQDSDRLFDIWIGGMSSRRGFSNAANLFLLFMKERMGLHR